MTRRFQDPEWETILRENGFTYVLYHGTVGTSKSIDESILPPVNELTQHCIFTYRSEEFPGISVTFQRTANVFVCLNNKESPSRFRVRLAIIAMKRVFGL